MKKTYSSPKLTEYGTVNELTNIFTNPSSPILGLKPGQPLPTATQSSSDGILAH